MDTKQNWNDIKNSFSLSATVELTTRGRNDSSRDIRKPSLGCLNHIWQTMAEEYVLVRKTYDHMKKREVQEIPPTKDQCTMTQEQDSTPPLDSSPSETPPKQSGSGFLYSGSRKRKATSPPGWRPTKKRRTDWMKFWWQKRLFWFPTIYYSVKIICIVIQQVDCLLFTYFFS